MTDVPKWVASMRPPHNTAAALYYKGSDRWTPTTEAEYWESLESVPPMAMWAGGFAMGEPLTHDDRGVAVTAVYRGPEGRRELRYMPVDKARGTA